MPRERFDEQHWRDRLRAAGLRVTPTRLDILRVMAASETPLNALDLQHALPAGSADRVTIYRTLASFVKVGLAHRIDPGDRVWRFRLTEEAHADHPHFVCDACGAVECLDDASVRISLDDPDRERAARITQSDVYLHGACDTCAGDDDRAR